MNPTSPRSPALLTVIGILAVGCGIATPEPPKSSPASLDDIYEPEPADGFGSPPGDGTTEPSGDLGAGPTVGSQPDNAAASPAPVLSETAAGQVPSEVTSDGGQYIVKVNGTQALATTNLADALQNAVGTGNRSVTVLCGGDLTHTVTIRGNTTISFNPNQSIRATSGFPAFHCYKYDGIGIAGLNLTGSPSYGIQLNRCGNVNLENITMEFGNAPVAVAIRVDNADQNSSHISGLSAKNITVSNISGSQGHAIETWGMDNYYFDNITANNINGCSVLVNQSNNGDIGLVTGNRAGDTTANRGFYAALRFANSCANAHVNKVISRNSGRGFFTIDATNITVDNVDITDSTSDGILISGGSNVIVKSGRVVGQGPRIVSSPGSAIYLDGATTVADGRYRLRSRGNGKYLDSLGYTGNGDPVGQWEASSSNNQVWNLSTSEGAWRKLQSVASGKSLDNMGRAQDGSEVSQWESSGSWNQQWQIEPADSGYYYITNRSTGKCLDTNGSTGQGASVTTWSKGGNWNQLWSFSN